jgi:hypothetical protein
LKLIDDLVLAKYRWSPVVNQQIELASGSGKSGRKPQGKRAGGVQNESGTYDIRMGPIVHSGVSGYRPSCDCGGQDSIPGILLDVCCGSGTSGEVARECGVRFIGLDVSFPYLEWQAMWRSERRHSRARINDLPLFQTLDLTAKGEEA